MKSQVVQEPAVLDLIRSRHSKLLAAGLYLEENAEPAPLLTRPLLALILGEAEQLEEILDAYGARYNSRWLTLRELIAAARVLSRVAYTILHIKHSFHRYRLRDVKHNTEAQTEVAARYLSESLTKVMTCFMQQARELGLESRLEIYPDDYYAEHLPPGLLPRDRQARHVEGADQTVIMLATECLDLAAHSSFLHAVDGSAPSRYRSYIPDPISEESLRRLEYRFHNLQSLYDTYLLGSDMEDADANLPTLRGHISIIFHLLQAATSSVHFYERHVMLSPPDFNIATHCRLDVGRLLSSVIGFSVVNAGCYLHGMRSLCHSILSKYVEISKIEAPIPAYRGFHVRPATLIAKVVLHYGSSVTMELKGQTYDAGNTLDLFRANESVNAEKRRRIAEQIAALPEPEITEGPTDYARIVRRAIIQLAESNELVIYEHPLPVEKEVPRQDQSLREFIIQAVKRLLALGKIDLESPITVTFTGDKRVLRDLKLLAENGYGEDRFGNNIPLPPELGYLRQGQMKY